MRWQVPILLVLLVTPLLLAGCTTSSDDADSPATLEDDEAFVRVFVKRPIGLADHPIWELQAAPRLVAFIAGDNHTREALNNSGYVAVAAGWPDDWGQENHTDEEYPESALQDWMRPEGLWFEGVVPAGNYSTIRIEIVTVLGEDDAGRALDIEVMGERISVGPAEGDLFHVTAGKTHTFVFEAALQRTGTTSYFIR